MRNYHLRKAYAKRTLARYCSRAIFVWALLLSVVALKGQTTFNFTGTVQSYTVPVGATSVTIDARGAQGGGSFGGAGGLGARMTGTFATTPGEVLSVVVGQQGLLQVGGQVQNSSGGGGGTFVFRAGPSLLVAAGGGGGKCNYTSSAPLHPAADGQIGTAGGASSDGNPGGVGGAGGPAGLWSSVPCAGGGTGWNSNGGGPYGGLGYNTWTGGPGYCGGGGGGCGGVGGYGGGGGGGNHYGGGGGGGGYSGGGGGTDPTHGGGGGSYNSGTSQANTAGFQPGNGQVIITPIITASPCATPTGVLASPSTICTGSTANLNATSTGNSISWYTVPSGGAPIGTSLSGANFGVTPGSTTTYYAEANGISVGPGSQTFNFTGGAQTFTVPTGVNSVTIVARGARGGTCTNDSTSCGLIGGLGGSATGNLAVVPGQVLTVYVGGRGLPGSAGGFNGGGAGCSNTSTCSSGGGASDVRAGGTGLANRVIVGAGGGGTEYSACNGTGGIGGGLTGGTGSESGVNPRNGGGASQVGGGAGGVGGYNGGTGTLGQGGIAGNHPAGHAGGGGGGYYGGGGSAEDGHAGGGSSYIGGVTAGSTTAGVQSGNGQVVISWTGVSCTTSPRTAVTVNVTQNPTASNAGPNQTLCGTSTTLAANSPASGTGSWSIISGAGGSIATPGSASSGFSGVANTTYTLRWTVANPPCASSTDDVLVTFVGAPTTANAGPDQVLCATSTTLAANAPAVGTGLWSIVSGAGGSIGTPGSASSGFSGTPGVLYVVRWTISNPPCAASTDDVQIYFTPATTVSNAGPNQTICGTSAFLAGNAPSNGTGTWSIIAGSGGNVTNPANENSQFTGNANTTYTLRWTIANSPCPTSIDDVVITLTGAPTVANAGPDQNVCGVSATLAGNPATSGSGTWTIVAGVGGSIATPGSPTSGFSGIQGNTYTLRWTIANPPCTETADDVLIVLNGASTIANAGPNQILCATTTTLAANTPALGSGLWTIVSGAGGSIANPSSPTSPFTLTAGVTYNLRWTVTNPPCNPSFDDVLIFTDNLAPTVNCPANMTATGIPGQCAGIANYTTPVGTDNCPSPTTVQTAGLASGASFPAGITTNTFTTTDVFGNTASCSFTVNVVDNQFPTINCPSNIVTTVNPGLCNATVTFPTPTGIDNCGGATTTQIAGLSSGASFPRGNVLNTFRVTDGAGNASTCSFTVTVNDNEAPVINCPANITANAVLGTCNATVTYTVPTGTDNCTGATTLRISGQNSGTVFPIGVTNNIFRVTDGSGNSTTCSFTVTVNDSEAPTATCPANIAVPNSPGMCAANVSFTAPTGIDNCSATTTSLVSGLPSGGAFPVGTTTNIFAVSDVSSNSTTCSFTVTVSDNEGPTAICQNIILPLDSTGTATVTTAAVDNNSVDNCTSLNYAVTPTTFNCGNLGANTVVLTLSDQNGNSSTCSAVVTVTSSPVAVAILADTTSCGFNVSCFAGSDGVATASGVGGCPTYSYLWSNGQSGATATGLGAGTHTVTVTDVNGGTIVSTITLTTPPPFNVTTASTNSCEGSGTGTITAVATGGNDCQSPTYQWSNGATTASVAGLTPGIYNLTVTDAGGCTVSRSITIATLPTPLPTFSQSGNTLTSTQTWSSYQWLLGGNAIPGATNSSFTVAQSGTYALSVTDTNGCAGTSNADTLVFVGMADPTGQWTGLSIYPNPTRDEFKLRTEMPIGHALTVTVRDLYGRELFARTLSHLAQEEIFEIRNLAASTYLVEVTSKKGQRKVFRLVVE
ncbi:MAG: HYR domain-containing protein [Bacteroidetes bacterium]|nr:HYR domain-containing protein [Bacteroidota bacterium]